MDNTYLYNQYQLRIQQFSLVELLVVLVIMGVMLGMFLPVFNNMTSRNKLNSSIRIIGSRINLARQYAQSNREFAALITPAELTNVAPVTNPALDLDDEKKYRAYRLAVVTLSAGTYTFSSWIEGTKWEYLPTGYSLMEVDDDMGVQKIVGGSLAYTTDPEDNNASKVNGVPFDSPLFDATTDFTATCRALIFAKSGKPRPVGDHRYVTIGEATRLNGFWVVKNPFTDSDTAADNPNRSASNQLTIKVNAFTAGLKYIVPEKYTDYD